MSSTQQPIAIVTGGNRGIGVEICRGLARLGYHVILTSRDLQKGQQTAEHLRGSGQITVHQLDVTSAESVQALKAYITQEFKRVDALVNNAAVYLDEGVSVLDVDMDTVRTTFETNLYGPFMMCQAFVPMMHQQNYGRVVNVSSEAGSIHSMPGYTAAYRMSKAALNALTRIVASEVRGKNIKVNSMCPGWVRTDMGGSGASRSPEQGADTAIWLATLPDDGPTNGYFRDRRPIDW
jgi:NAD(P)-dependent dehydrogenase (short-subunit alcohol dehydrogenase family)